MEIPTHWLVSHDCGHEQIHDLTNKPAGGRNRVASWLARRSCSECKAAVRAEVAARDWREERRQEKLREIARWEHQVDMPTLDGSPKAVEWGRDVRFRLLDHAADYFREEGWGETEFIIRVELPAAEVATASWWIEHREIAVAKVENEIARALAQLPVRPTEVITQDPTTKEKQ